MTDNATYFEKAGVLHTYVMPNETEADAKVRVSVAANRNGSIGYCVDCEICKYSAAEHQPTAKNWFVIREIHRQAMEEGK